MFNLASSQYVVFDASFLDGFFTYIKGSMGTAVNVGIVAFAIIFGVFLVVSIVRKFVR